MGVSTRLQWNGCALRVAKQASKPKSGRTRMIGFGRLFYFLIGARIALPASPHPPDPVSRKSTTTETRKGYVCVVCVSRPRTLRVSELELTSGWSDSQHNK